MVKQALVVFGLLGLSVLGGLIGTWMYDFLIPASIPLLPLVPIGIYYAVVLLVSTVYALGLALAAWLLLKGGWRLFSSGERRAVVWGKIRSWPSSKWDAFTIAALAYFLGVMSLLVAAAFVLPRGTLVGVIAPEEGTRIMVLALTPLVAALLIIMVKLGMEEFKTFKTLWITGTSRERRGFFISLGIVVSSGVVLAIGELVGWDQTP